MNFDISQLAPRDAYKLLTGLVVPRPIALVTTLGENDVVNAAPFSFFNMMGSDPPLVVFAPGSGSPHTADNIRRHQEFVVHIVNEEIADGMNICATDFPEGVSEIEAAGFTLESSTRTRVPRIAQAPAALECREHSTLEIGRNRMIIGEVLHVYVRDDLVNERLHIDLDRMKIIGRMAGGGGGYCRTNDRFEIARMSYEEWEKGD